MNYLDVNGSLDGGEKRLKELREDIIELEAIHARLNGMKDAYAQGFQTVSRIVSLRTFGGANA